MAPQRSSHVQNQGAIRIIGGKWRGRKFCVPVHPGLRPTPSRVRETLFNWLTVPVVGAYCLDLFAGTGILGWEALSRGAAKVVFVDQHPPLLAAIQEKATQLGATSVCACYRSCALDFLKNQDHQTPPFDIIFLDPPFESTLLASALSFLSQSPLVKSGTLLYIEAPRLFPLSLPSHWTLLRAKTAGEVSYYLVQGGGA